MFRYSDSCWQLAYSNDENGNADQGSIAHLKSAIELGHRLRVIIDGVSIEPDDVRIRGGHVTAMMLNKVLKESNNIKIIDPAGVWDWGLISTTGTHRSLRLQLGAAVETTGSRATATKAAAWYIDTRPWVKVLEHSKTGEVTFGSKAALVEAVRKGAQVRYVMQFDSDTTTIQEADNLAISGDNVGSMHVRSVSLQGVANSAAEFEFQPNPYWWFTIASTTGNVAMSRLEVIKLGVYYFKHRLPLYIIKDVFCLNINNLIGVEM